MSDILDNIFHTEEDYTNDNMYQQSAHITEVSEINDPLFTKNFFKNTSNYEAFDKMINFDTQEKCDKIYDIIKTFFESNLNNFNESFIDFGNSDNAHFEILINKHFSELIKYFISIDFKNQEKCENIFSYIFLEFCDYINYDYNKVFLVLHEKFQNIIKRDLIKIIKFENYIKIENKIKNQSENTINNHKDVYFRKLV